MSEESGWAVDPASYYVPPIVPAYTPPTFPSYSMPTGMMTYDDYLNAQLAYVRPRMDADPQWQAYINSMASGGGGMDAADAANSYNGTLAAPSKDYYGEWFGMLSPEQQSEYMRLLQEDKEGRWQTKVGNVLKYIPAAVAAVGTAGAAGLLGSSAGFPGTAIWSGAPAAAAPVAEAASTMPLWDTGVGGLFGSQAAVDSALASAGMGGTTLGGLSAAPALGGALAASPYLGAFGATASAIPTAGSLLESMAPAAGSAFNNPAYTSIPGSGGLLDKVGSGLGSIGTWAANNPGLLSSLIGLGAAGMANSSNNSQPKPQAQIQMQPGLKFAPPTQAPSSPAGLLSGATASPYKNSGLGRFGATGGVWKPWGAL